MATVIYTATQLQNMSADLAADYELGGNINASETAGWNAGAGFAPIGDSVTPFTGNFDGKGYTITGLTINRPATDDIGLFGYAGSPGGGPTVVYVKNVVLESASIVGLDQVGALVGEARDYVYIEDCRSSGTVSGRYSIGGLVGELGASSSRITWCSSSCEVTGSTMDAGGLFGGCQGTVTDSYATGDVHGEQYAGGLGSLAVSASVVRCFATGDVDTTDDYAGGLFGYAGDSSVTDCYARGSVTAAGVGAYAGGVVGDASVVIFTRCYATGAVSAAVSGGFGGYKVADASTFEDCLWDTETTGEASSWGAGGSPSGITGYTTAEMQSASVIQANGYLLGRDWNVIGACNGGYPCLIGVNPCCSVRGVPADVTIARTKPSLELIRNLEMQCDGLSYVTKAGLFKYESRYARHG
jgi:hypothetical protein